MRRTLVVLFFLSCEMAFGQETTIRILGAYPSHLSISSAAMTEQLNGITTTWNNSGLPGASVTTVQVLNNGVAVPVSYSGLPSTNTSAAQQAYQQAAIQNLRHQWQADVIVLFTNNTDHCGAANSHWYNGNFVPNSQGLDLRYRHEDYVPVVTAEGCPPHVGAHEFGHVLGGGHYDTGDRLYSDARAWYWWDGYIGYVFGTALLDPTDVGATWPTAWEFQYSRIAGGWGDDGHENVRTLSITARSVANFYEYPNVPPVLNPPINLTGIHVGCVNGVETRHDIYWSDDPGTNVPISHYEIWKSQPVGQPYVYGWTVYGRYDDTYVSGTTARARVNACSGGTCSALSSSYYDAYPSCGW